MKRILLTVAYDGTGYCGWQTQPNGVTVEEVLNRCLSALLGEDIHVIGASRTDSGVHALGNVAVFDTETKIPPEKIAFALNQRLPEDIRIQSSKEVPLNFHPRKKNSRKTYEYRIWNSPFSQPLCRLYSYFVFTPLDVEAMNGGAQYLKGEHDFSSFCSAKTQAEDKVRTIYHISVSKEGNMVKIQICGNGFLYNMVRIIAGTLIRVGQGAYPPERVKEILLAKDRGAAGQKAPAKGLTMVGIEFEKELEDIVRVENESWSYMLFQDKILKEKKGYILLLRCEKEEFEPTVIRLIRKMERDGASEVYVADRQERISDGFSVGRYTFEPGKGPDREIMENRGFCGKKQEIKWFLALDTPDSV